MVRLWMFEMFAVTRSAPTNGEWRVWVVSLWRCNFFGTPPDQASRWWMPDRYCSVPSLVFHRLHISPLSWWCRFQLQICSTVIWHTKTFQLISWFKSIVWTVATRYGNLIQNWTGNAKLRFRIMLRRWRTGPLWSSGQSSWLLTQRSRIRFPALPVFLSSSGSWTGFTQPLWG
jgi:hypothetical protein